MGQLSRDSFQRLYAMCLIGRFPNGVYGGVRLQKVNFFAEEPVAAPRPFSVHYHHFGEFSHDLATTLEQLLAMNYVFASPLRSGEGNRYGLRDQGSYTLARKVLSDATPSLVASIDKAVTNYGMLSQDNLLTRAYAYLKEHGIEPGDLILEEALPESVDVPSLSDDDCDEIELALNPDFTQNARLLIEALEDVPLDLSKVPVFGELSATGA